MGQRRDLLGYVLPKTVVGLALWLLIFALGAGASGVVFFVAYERRLSDLDAKVTQMRSELEKKISDAVTQLQQADRANQVTGTGAVGPAGDAARLIASVGPAVAIVEGADVAGAATSGSGFVMYSSANQSWLLTSYHLVAGSIAAAQGATPSPTATVAPPTSGVTPTVVVHVGGLDRSGTVYSWDAAHDLALVIVPVGSVPTLTFSSAVPSPGLQVWAVGGASGALGATAAKGQLVTSTAQTYATDAVFGPRSWGGPLVDAEGRVLGVLTSAAITTTATPGPSPAATGPSPAASPNSPPPGQAVPVRLACLAVVVCPR